MPPFAESQEQDPIIMATGYDDSSVITDDSFFDKPKQNGNTDTHDVTTKKETSKVVLSFYDVMMDFNLCCSTRHDDDETVVAGSTRKTSCKYAQAEISLPHKKYNKKKIQEEEHKEEEVEVEQEEKVMMSTNNNNTTLAYEKNKKKCSRVNRIYKKSTSPIKKVHSSQSTTTTTTTTTHLSSSSNQKEKKSNIVTVWIKKSLSIQKLKSIRMTMNKASVPTINKKKKKTASVMMTNGTFSFSKKTNMKNKHRNKNESQGSNNAGLSSFVKQMHRMGYSRSVTTKQNHAYNEIRTKLTQ